MMFFAETCMMGRPAFVFSHQYSSGQDLNIKCERTVFLTAAPVVKMELSKLM